MELLELAYTDNDVLFQIPRRFTFKSNKIEEIDYPINREYYFDPKITVGLGETFGVGISSNLFLGITTDRSSCFHWNWINNNIYLPKH